MTYRALLDDPTHIRALDGQRFVVLRVHGRLAETFVQLRDTLRAELSGSEVSSPAWPHVTLAGFAAGTPTSAVQELVRAWSPAAPPLNLEPERVTIFPAPYQIVVLQIRKTPELFAALVDLRRRAADVGLTLSTVVPAEQWIFHISLVYGSALDAEAWRALEAFSRGLTFPPERDVAGEAEIVAFDEAHEYSGGVHRLRGSSFRVIETGPLRVIEGPADGAVLAHAQDATRLVEACAGEQTDAVLLYPSNLTPAFFDLSSRDAGEILQKLRQYGIRLAVVCTPGGTRFSSRFGEAVAEERDRGWFGLFDTREAALAWLSGPGQD